MEFNHATHANTREHLSYWVWGKRKMISILRTHQMDVIYKTANVK